MIFRRSLQDQVPKNKFFSTLLEQGPCRLAYAGSGLSRPMRSMASAGAGLLIR